MDDFRRRNLIEKDEFTSSSNPKSEKKGKSLVEALLGDSENFKLVAERFNLDPEMSEKIVVPLLSLLDKYGIGESITSSPQLESASNTMEIIRDVAPVVRGAAEFISGRRAELESDDLAFLEEIKKSQSVSDASLFNSEEDDELFTIGESVNPAPAQPQPPQQDFNAFQKDDWGNFWADATGANKQESFLDNDLTRQMENQQSALDQWTKQQMGGSLANAGSQGAHTVKQEGIGGDFDLGIGLQDTFSAGIDTSFSILDVSALAKEQGLSVDEVMGSDSQRKMSNEEEELDFTVDLTDLQEEENTEIDYSEFEVPEDAENYDPFHIKGYEVPELSVDLEEFQEFLPEVFDDEEQGDA